MGNKKKNILLIAGKGHEEYQEINGKKKEFSDFIQVEKFLEEVWRIRWHLIYMK